MNLDAFPTSFETMTPILHFRPATPNDAALLARWDKEPHIIACNPNDRCDDWDEELRGDPSWREQWKKNSLAKGSAP